MTASSRSKTRPSCSVRSRTISTSGRWAAFQCLTAFGLACASSLRESSWAKSGARNTGHPGGAATVHANDSLSGLIRLESLVAEATSAPQQTLIAEAVDLVVFVDEESSVKAGRKVREVLLVTGYSNGNYQVERV